MKTMNNRTAPLDDREILMPDDLMHDIDSILSGEPAENTEADSVPDEAADSDYTGKDASSAETETDYASVPDKDSTAVATSDEEDWNSFLNELKNYDNGGNREERCSCRIDIDLSDALEEIEILGYSRPDILSSIVRKFLKRHLARLKDLRRVNKSFFNKINSQP